MCVCVVQRRTPFLSSSTESTSLYLPFDDWGVAQGLHSFSAQLGTAQMSFGDHKLRIEVGSFFVVWMISEGRESKRRPYPGRNYISEVWRYELHSRRYKYRFLEADQTRCFPQTLVFSGLPNPIKNEQQGPNKPVGCHWA